jgi:dihydrofolate reductase
MTVLAAITTSIDGYYAGPDDRVGQGLGEGGERLHDWQWGGEYGTNPDGPVEVDRRLLDERRERVGAVLAGRTTYDLAEAWGGHDPYPVSMFIVTHRPDDEPPDGEFTFVNGLDTALERARAAARERDVLIMGGGSLIREALLAGVVDELHVSLSPILLGGGKRLFDGYDAPLDLEPIWAVASPFATHLGYRVGRGSSSGQTS